MSYNAPSIIQRKDSVRFVWDVLSTLPPALQHTGAQVLQFCSDCVKFDKSKGVNSFNLTEFKDAVDDLPNVDFVMEAFNVENVTPGPVAQLPATFASVLVNKFNIPIAESEVFQAVRGIFRRLDYAKQDGVADFHVIPAISKTKVESVWEYRLLMMAPNANVSNDFHVQVAVLEVKAQKEHESDWVPLKDDLQAASVKITMMKLAVTKGFRRPVPTIPFTKA
ncbi:hypothetical protein RSOLAG22IIIB_07601 [Rhizoctonia solani]|uniref:Delta-endotoxin CytB n=1 Tax=Rhizoctonia solani TaxID=456999 RepID=A0A0K6FP11_9AGAM|nr:hypothetical protein RSOLAG22IIIB_07601 [Rhizoctonia solani]